MTTILLARHGETDWNRDNRFQGHADPPLNRHRSRAGGRAGEEPSRTSRWTPSTRARCAGRSRPPRSLPLRTVSSRCRSIALREVDVGSWEGLTRAEIEQRFPEQFARWLDYEQGWDDGETYEEMGLRVIAALFELAAAHEGTDPRRVARRTGSGRVRPRG